MSQTAENLQKNGIELPAAAVLDAPFKPYVITGNHVYVSGQLPMGFGDMEQYKGQVGTDYTLEKAQEVSRICALNVLAQVKEACGGDLDKVKRCVKLVVFVNSAPDFTMQPAVANPASELMVQALGERGEHARSAIGTSQLPLGVAVEIEAVFEI